MKIGYFDCVGGASGDMLLGALVDAGAAPEAIQAAVDALRLPGVALSFERVTRNGLAATLATVQAPEQPAHRHVPDLLELIGAADLPEALKTRAAQIVQRVAVVEAAIHNEPVEQVHLHELGGDDTLADIVGALAGVADLGLEAVYVSALLLARGFTNSAHGQLPLPAPATLKLLEGAPVQWVETPAELVTPTGAALLTGLAAGFGGFPPMTLGRVGSGAGRKSFPFPNVLRLWLGDAQPTPLGLQTETLAVLETNIDDLNPQVYDHLSARLFAAGALDVTLTPLHMKKNRPAVLVSVLARPTQSDDLLAVLLAETTTLGVRRSLVERLSLPRTQQTVATPYGPVRVKVTWWQGRRRAVPEYDDCRAAAEAHGVPLVEVQNAARQAAQSLPQE